MKNDIKNKFYPQWLQLFAEGDGAGSGNGNGGGAGGSGDGNGSSAGNADGNKGGLNNDPEPMSFDEFLSGEGNQAEFDRRVQKAIETAVSNAQKKWKTLTDDKVSEAEKLAQMNREEKAEYRAKQLEEKLAELERENAVADMSKTARKLLSEEEINIPDELLVLLVSDDAEKTKAAVSAFAEMYKAAVQNAVKDKLKGNPPKSGEGNNITKEQITAIKDPMERQRMIAKHIELFQ